MPTTRKPRTPKSAAVRITATVMIPYDKRVFGEAGKAETAAIHLQTEIEALVADYKAAAVFDFRHVLVAAPEPVQATGLQCGAQPIQTGINTANQSDLTMPAALVRK